jgi:AraC family transcriptional regulator of adaptative response / methylphosphotriester-DNA alkyltransferase methyltransferase
MSTPVQHRPLTIALRRELYAEVREYLDERFGESDLTLDDVARAVSSSRRQVQRLFEEDGDTFRAYLTRLRMQRAADMLADTAMPVRDIARRVGYRQSAQFAKAFRRFGSVTPLQWRGGRRGPSLTEVPQLEQLSAAA